MATQTGSIDLRGANSAKLYVDDEAGEIRSEVSETYATKTEVRRIDTGSGTFITSDDAANLPPLFLTIHGKSVQDGTPSPSSPVAIKSVEATNLLDYDAWKSVGITNGTAVFENNGVTLTASANDCYTVTAVPTAARVPVTEGEVVYLTWDSPDTYSGTCYIFPNGTTSGMKSSNNSSARFVQYTVGAGVTYITYRVGVATAGNTIHYENIRITKTRATEYAPKGSISVRSSRNLFNGISVAQNVKNGVTWSYDAESNRLKASGTPTADNNDLQISFKTPITVPEGVTSLTFSFDGTFVSSNTYFFLRDNASGWSYKFIPSEGKCTFTDMGGHAFSYCMIRTYTNSGNISIDATIQVEYGTEATEHALYSPAAAYIDLKGNAVRSLPGGTEDTLVIDGEGNVTLTKRVGIVTGSDLVQYKASNGYVAYRKAAATSTVQNNVNGRTLCSWTTANESFSSSNMTKECVQYPWANSQTVYVAALEGRSLDDFCLLYVLAEPQTIPLGKIDLPSLPSPSFSLHVDALVTPTLDAEWWTQGGEEVGSVYQRTSALEQDVDGITLELSEKVDSSEEWVSWLHAGTDATTHEPYLAMGKDSDYPSVVYSTDAARFYDGEGDAAANVVASFGSSAIIGKTGAAHFEQTSTAAKWYGGDGTTQLAEVSTDNNVPRLWLGDSYRYLIAGQDSSTSDGVTTYIDHLDIRNYAVNSSHNAEIELFVWGTSGGASFRVSDGSTGATLNVTPNRVVAQVELWAQQKARVDGIFDHGGTVALSTTAKNSWLTALGMDVETIQNDSAWTILRYGHVVMVQCHGYQGAANANTAKLAGVLANYKPQYNVSSTISTSAGTSTQVARLCVYASDGGVYIAPAGYTSSATWYGTLTYIY